MTQDFYIVTERGCNLLVDGKHTKLTKIPTETTLDF